MLLAFLLSVLQCSSREMRITFYTLAEGTHSMRTRTGHPPLAFRAAAVGDRRLLGRWLYVEDLGGWVHASDAGRPREARIPGPCLREDTIDILVGAGAPGAPALGLGAGTRWLCRRPLRGLANELARFAFTSATGWRSSSSRASDLP